MNQQHNSAIRHSDLLCQQRIFAQSTIDALADAMDVPLAIVRAPNIRDLFNRLSKASSFFREKFPDLSSFAKLVTSANTTPDEVVKFLAKDMSEFRHVFENFHREIFYTRSTRSEPILRMLRDHWTWTWVEALALYDRLIAGDISSVTSRFYESFGSEVWLSTLVSCDAFSGYVFIGPVKNKGKNAQFIPLELDSFVEKYYAVLREVNIQPIHPAYRYQQFFFDHPAFYADNFERQRDILKTTLKPLTSIVWPQTHTVDSFDITAAVEFSYYLAGLFSDPNSDHSIRPKFSIAYTYPLQLSVETHEVRQLICATDGSESAATLPEIKYKNAKAIPLTLKPIFSSGSSNISLDYLNRRFEHFVRKRRTAQTQRMLEELLLLRIKLSEPFGDFSETSKFISSGKQQEKQSTQHKLGTRIARAACQICNADAATIYRYVHRDGVLLAVGTYNQLLKKSSPKLSDYKWMEAAGLTDARNSSISYNAIDNDRCAYFNNGRVFAPSLYSVSSRLIPPKDSAVSVGNSVVAVPIKVLGRMWGVLEIVSTRSDTFSYSDFDILQKIADFIGPYYHEHFIMSALNDIASPSQRAPDAKGQFDKIAEVAAEIFLTEGACVWVRDLAGGNRFDCLGFVGRPDLVRLRESNSPLPWFSDENTDSVSFSAIKDKRFWVFGEIGQPPFSGAWLEKPHTLGLIESKFRYIALTPVYDVDRNGVAVMAFYSKTRSFAQNWEDRARFMAEYLGAIVTRVHNVKELERRARRLVAHEIKNSVTTVRRSARKIFRFIDRLPAATQRPSNLRNWISDVNTHANDIESGIAGWVGDDVLETLERNRTIYLAAAEARIRTQDAVEVNFRSEFNTCFQPLTSDMKKKLIALNTSYPPKDLILLVHPENLRMILNNLSANAVKYSPTGSTIHCAIVDRKYTIRFYIRNIGPSLEEGEEDRIFDMGFRGRRAMQHSTGSGLGLYIVKTICGFYDIDISYEVASIANSSNVWHQFNLDFPSEIVKGGGWY
jgi:signal transduction histidine kinase